MDNSLLLSCYIVSSFILLLSSLVNSLELLAIKKSFNNLIYSEVSKPDKSFLINIHHPKIKNKFHLALVLLSLVGLFLLLTQPLSLPYKIVFLIVAFLNFYSYVKRKVGKDGADQLRMLAFLSFSLCFFASGHFVQILPLFFMGSQLLIAYGTSGLAKVFSVHWRKGHVLADVLNAHSFSSHPFARFLKAHPRVEKFCSHSAIFSMLFVPVAFFIPIPEIFYVALLGVLCFHIANAIFMGLNDFLFTFPLAYPAVFYLYHSFHTFFNHEYTNCFF